jgi:hypothetical protein
MVGFFESAGIGPSVMLDTVAGDDRARAILATPAVDEDGLGTEQRQNGPNLVRSRRGPGAEGYAHVVHPQGGDLLPLSQCVAAFFAKIDYQLYALRVEFLERDVGGYRAPIQTLVYLAKIPDVKRQRRAGPSESRCRKQRSENRNAFEESRRTTNSRCAPKSAEVPLFVWWPGIAACAAIAAEEDWQAEQVDSGRWRAAEGLLLQPCHIEWCFVS